jgi:tetratricopeptide (TPR) repeat protein
MKWLGLALLPWLFIRLYASMAGHDPETRRYFEALSLSNRGRIEIQYYLSGLWHGIRWAWAFVAIWLVFQWRETRWRMWLLLGFLLTLAVSLVIAWDISRSISMFVPAVIMGILLLRRHRPSHLRPVLLAACGLNLLFPAKHVAGNCCTPIQYFYAALHNAPPDGDLWFLYDNQLAVTLMEEGRTEEALHFFDLSIQLDPTHIDVYANRAVAYARLGRLRETLSKADHEAAMSPKTLEALLNRSALRALSGDSAGAFADLDQVLKEASPDWPGQAETLAARERLRAKLAAGR